MTPGFQDTRDAVRHLIRDAASIISHWPTSSSESLRATLQYWQETLKAEAPWRIALLGEAGVGKTSLIRAVSGNDEAHLGTDEPTAAVGEHDWHGMVFVDTPGLYLSPSELVGGAALSAAMEADMILLVVTPELPYRAQAGILRRLLDQDNLCLGRPCCLVVNKIDRDRNGGAGMQQRIEAVLGRRIGIPVLHCSVAKYFHARQASAGFRERLLRQSRLSALVTSLSAWGNQTGQASRAIAAISAVEGVMRDVMQSGDEPCLQARIACVQKEIAELEQAREHLHSLARLWHRQVYSTVLGRAAKAMERLDGTAEAPEVQAFFTSTLDQMKEDLSKLWCEMERQLHEILGGAGKQLENRTTQALHMPWSGGSFAPGTPGSLDAIRIPASPALRLTRLVNSATGPIAGGLEAASISTKALGNLLYEIAGSTGIRLVRTEALRRAGLITRASGRLAAFSPLLATILDLYLHFREEKIEDAKRRYVTDLRRSLRAAFRQHAEASALGTSNAIERFGNTALDNIAANLTGQLKDMLERQAISIGLGKQSEEVADRCKALKQQLHDALNGATPRIPGTAP